MDRDMRIRILMSAIGDAAAPVKKLARAASNSSKDVRKLQGDLRQIAQFRKLKLDVITNRREMAAAQARAQALGRAIAATEAPTRKMRTEFRQAQRDVTRLKDVQGRHLDQLKRMRGELGQAGVSTRNLANDERRLRTEVERATRALDQQKNRLARMKAAQGKAEAMRGAAGQLAMAGAATAGAGAVATAPFIAGARQAMSFEDALADLNKVANATPAQMKALAAGFTQLSETLPFTRSELAAIGADLKRGGVPVDELKAATAQAAELGVALGMAPDEAGAMASKWRSAYKMTRREIQLTGDLVNELTNRFGGNVGDISGIVTRSGAFAKASGVGAGTVGAVASAMNSAGVGEEIGATGFKNMILALGKGEAATDGQRKAWKELGLESTAMAKLLRSDAAGAITLVMERLSKLPEHTQAAAMDRLFGSESIGAIAPLLTDLDGLKKRLELVRTEGQYAGSAARELKGELGKTSTQLKIIENQKQNALAAVGEPLLSEIRDMGRFLGAVAAGLGRFAQKHPTLVKIAAALAVIVAAIGALMIVVAAILAPLAALTSIAGALGVSVGAIMLPILLVVAAIAALIAIGYLLWKNWDLIKLKAGELWEWFKRLPGMFLELGKAIIRGLVHGMLEMMGPLGDVVRQVASMLPDKVKAQLGIKSPSRVFAAIGRDTMAGLALGLQRGRDRPLSGLQGTAAAMSAAIGMIAAPSAALAFVGPPQGPRQPPASQTVAGSSFVFNITINNPPAGMDPKAAGGAIAAEIHRKLGGGGGSRRSFGNDSDGD